MLGVFLFNISLSTFDMGLGLLDNTFLYDFCHNLMNFFLLQIQTKKHNNQYQTSQEGNASYQNEGPIASYIKQRFSNFVKAKSGDIACKEKEWPQSPSSFIRHVLGVKWIQGYDSEVMEHVLRNPHEVTNEWTWPINVVEST